MTNFEILEQCPQYLFNVDKIERARQIVRQEKYKSEFRKVDVTYIFGETGTGKTRGVVEKHGYVNVYRVTDYDHPFDNYNGQKVLAFDEFFSSLRIQDMLQYLDGHPFDLPCRYANRVACYEMVYIISNTALEQQYITIQNEYQSTWKAFLRRIGRVFEYTSFGIEEYSSTVEYLNRFKVIQEDLGVFH